MAPSIHISSHDKGAIVGLHKLGRNVLKGVTVDNLQKLNKIMLRCIEAVIGTKGAHTKY